MLLDFNKFSFVLFGSMVRAEGHGRVEREEYERWREEVKPCSLSKIRTFHSSLCNPSNTNQVQYLGYVIYWKHVASSLGGQRVSLACVHGLGGTVAS